ncbi:hypothetical protein JCM21900_005689 [Sporobolomyces salmonicolor]
MSTATPPPPPTLLDHLSASLRSSVPGKHAYALHVVRSQPRRSHALFPHASNAKSCKIWQEEVLVVLSEARDTPQDANATAQEPPKENGDAPVASTSTAAPPASSSTKRFVPIVGIEASIYTVPSTSTSLLYISKVDTTGLSPSSSPSPTRPLVASFLSYHLLHPPHGTERLRIHIFARAQGQYLFPGSIENKSKRVLDDKGLIRWWKGTVERATRDVQVQKVLQRGTEELKLFYLIPGLTYLESLPYVPDPPLSAAASTPSPIWTYGHSYSVLPSPLHRAPSSPSPTAAAQHPLTDHLPSFPDDPKSRFLHALTSSSLAPSGTSGDYDDVFLALHSTTFTTGQTPAARLAEVEKERERERKRLVEGVQGGVDEWWERMAFRQECCSGVLVGFFVVAIEPVPSPPSARPPPSTTADCPAPCDAVPSPTVVTSTPTPHPPVHAPPKTPMSLPNPLFTKLWSQFHNVDYSLAALPKLFETSQKWAEDVGRLVKLEAADAGGGDPDQGVRGGLGEEELQRRFEQEVSRRVDVDNPELVKEKRDASGGAGEGEKPKVHTLAPRKKKKVV